MKQSIDEAAYVYATDKTKFRKDILKEVDTDNYVYRHSDCIKDFKSGAEWQKGKAIAAFKENCQRPKDTDPCECKLCVRWVGGHCELLDGFIEKLNS